MSITIHHGDCIEVMRTLPDNSVDSIVTDPPYGLGFMGKAWDALPPGLEWARECLRVLKPGGHLLAFGGTRTWHRLAVAVEDAGFEIRDSIAWLYSSGMAKSMDVSRAIDKELGAVREVGPVDPARAIRMGRATGAYVTASGWSAGSRRVTIDPPATKDAIKWQGWGTALKPSFEPALVGRKPLAGTVAATVLEYGTGALNIDATRNGERWPSNVILDQAQGDALAESKYFYVAKPAKKERPVVDGISHPTVKPLALMRHLVRLVTPPGGTLLDPFAGSGTTVEASILEGFDCIAIERESAYLPLIQARIDRQDAA